MNRQPEAAMEPLSEMLERMVLRAANKKRVSFRELVAAAHLDPAKDFIGAFLREVDLSGEDLRGFNFSDADLTGADFRGANLKGVRFDGAKQRGALGLPNTRDRVVSKERANDSTADEWGRVLGKLKAKVGEDAYRNWFRPINLVRVVDGHVIMSAPTRFLRDWVATQYTDRLLALWRAENERVERLSIVVADVSGGDRSVPLAQTVSSDTVIDEIQKRAGEQLDLFSQRAEPEEPHSPSMSSRPVIVWETLDDARLIAAFRNASVRDSIDLAAEAGRRRLVAAIPVLEAMCRRFAGFGIERIVPEQAAAVDALAEIGGPEAAQALTRIIAKSVVQGPCLQRAVSAAARLRAELPVALVLELLRHRDPQIRADACRCVGPWPEATAPLNELLDDLHPYVAMAAACALGRLGRSEARPLLVHLLREEPSAELIDAIAPIADEECIVLLGRAARTRPDLSEAVLDALDAIDHPRAEKIAGQIRT
jgi:uncharacterized protein YjbI with pentapeptide repeats